MKAIAFLAGLAIGVFVGVQLAIRSIFWQELYR